MRGARDSSAVAQAIALHRYCNVVGHQGSVCSSGGPANRDKLAIAIGNKMAHYVGGDIEKITNESGLSYFFLIFTIVPIVLGLVSFALHPLLKRLMHGVR